MPLPPGLGVLLRDHVRYLGLRPEQPIFKVSKRQVERVFVATGQRVLGRGVHPHQLRKLYATFLIDNGVPAPVVAHYLGHSDYRITEKWYYEGNVDKLAEIQRRVPA